MSINSGSRPQPAPLSARPGTTLAVAQEIPVDTRSVGLLKAAGQLLQKLLPVGVVGLPTTQMAGPDNRQLVYLSGAGQAGREMGCGAAG